MKNTNAARKTVLIVDDTLFNRELLTEILNDEYDILEAENGAEAVEIMEERHEDIALVLLDIVMPVMDGFGFLEQANLRGWIDTVPVIVLSSENTNEFVDRAYAGNVVDFISRPFDASIVRHRTKNTIALYAKQRWLQEQVEEQVEKREKDNQLMISILSHLVEFRNGESRLHVVNIGIITELLLRCINLHRENAFSEEDISRIKMASALHDVGKLAISSDVLNKPGRLTPEEFEIMKQHSAIGSDMLKDLMSVYDDPLLQDAYEISRWHHERYDGRGYPDGLVGDQIPIIAQAVAVADVYDALTSERCYKKAFSHETALEMILSGKCGTFSELMMTALREIEGQLKEKFSLFHAV